jgi:pseudouridine synthase
VEKSYLVTLAGQPDKKTLDRATRGIVVEGERLALEEVEVLGGRLRQASASLAEARPAFARSAATWSRRTPKAGRPDRRPPATEQKSERTRLRATLRRGKNREIRRLFEALGFPVLDLHRERIGGLSVRGIPPGGFRPLSRGEVELLQQRPRKRWSRREASGASPAGRKRTRQRRDARESGRPPGATSAGSERPEEGREHRR